MPDQTSDQPLIIIDAAAVILRCTATGRILLVRRGTSFWNDCWAFPGGRYETEDYALWNTARRETLEEVGLDLSRVTEPPLERQSVHLTHGTNVSGQKRAYRMTVFVVTVAQEDMPTVDGHEIREARWFSPAEIRDLRTGPATAEALKIHVPEF